MINLKKYILTLFLLGHQQLRHFILKLGGYEVGVVPGRSLYFKAFSEKKSWYDARKICQREGGDLVIVDDVRINNWLKGKAKNIWIAASDQVNFPLFTFMHLVTQKMDSEGET